MYRKNNDKNLQRVLLRYIYSQNIPEQAVPDVEAEFSAVLFEWMKTTAKEKLQAIRGGFGL